MLSKRQYRVLRILRQPELRLTQKPSSAAWAIELPQKEGKYKFLNDRLVRVSLKAKEVSDLSSLGYLLASSGWDGKSSYRLRRSHEQIIREALDNVM